MATTTMDYESIINEAAEKLESRFAEIQDELAPLRTEEREVAEAIHRIVGSYPAGFQSRPTVRTAPTRSRDTDEERAAKIVQIIQANPGQHGYKTVAEAIGVSPATATKTIKGLIESGQIKATGEKRGLRLHPV